MLAGALLCSVVGHDAELGEGSDQEACAVCLATMCGEETVLHLKCGHTFHCPCIGSWFRHQQSSTKAATCPVCRADAAPRECCKRAWTELSLTTQPNKEPSSEALVRRAATDNRSGPRLYLLVLLLCVVGGCCGWTVLRLYCDSAKCHEV